MVGSIFIYFIFILINLHVILTGATHPAKDPLEQITSSKTLNGRPTALYAHRGESILLPPHTLAGYEIATIEQADFVEPDLQLTKDGILICHHEFTLSTVTDVSSHPEFEHLKSNFSGQLGFSQVNIQNDWFIKDFTLAQLKSIKVVQFPIGIRSQLFNNIFEIPTFAEYLTVIHKMSAKLEQRLGIIPELKTPAFYNSLENRPKYFMETKFLKILKEFGYPTRIRPKSNCKGSSDIGSKSKVRIRCPQVKVQCFEEDTLLHLLKLVDFEMVLLVDNQLSYLTYDGIKQVSKKGVQEMCVWKEFIFSGIEKEARFLNYSYNAQQIQKLGGFVDPSDELVQVAHGRGLKLSIYTIKDSHEESGRGCAGSSGCLPNNKKEEMDYYFRLGVDGMFVENVGESKDIRTGYECVLKATVSAKILRIY